MNNAKDAVRFFVTNKVDADVTLVAHTRMNERDEKLKEGIYKNVNFEPYHNVKIVNTDGHRLEFWVSDLDSLFSFKRFVEHLIDIKNQMFEDFKSVREKEQTTEE